MASLRSAIATSIMAKNCAAAAPLIHVQCNGLSSVGMKMRFRVILHALTRIEMIRQTTLGRKTEKHMLCICTYI